MSMFMLVMICHSQLLRAYPRSARWASISSCCIPAGISNTERCALVASRTAIVSFGILVLYPHLCHATCSSRGSGRGPQVTPQDLWATLALSIRSPRVDLGAPLPQWEERRVHRTDDKGALARPH